MKHLHEDIRSQIQKATRFLILTHIRPDGDAVGSLLSMGLALKAAGKDVQMVLEDTVPSNLRHLAGCEQITQKPQGKYDFIIMLDCSDLKRAGTVINDYGIPDLNIDHHPTNRNYGRINLIESMAVATTEILAEFMPRWGLPITADVASALLTGLITDTLGFRTASVSPHTMRLVAELMEHGANLSDLYMKAFITRTFEAVHFWGYGLIQLKREGPIVWTQLAMHDRRTVGYSGGDDADLINILSSIKGAQVAIIFVEQPNGNVKVSWRAHDGVDVAHIATIFGGGGHVAAAGAEIVGDMDQVETRVLEETRNSLVNHYAQEHCL